MTTEAEVIREGTIEIIKVKTVPIEPQKEKVLVPVQNLTKENYSTRRNYKR